MVTGMDGWFRFANNAKTLMELSQLGTISVQKEHAAKLGTNVTRTLPPNVAPSPKAPQVWMPIAQGRMQVKTELVPFKAQWVTFGARWQASGILSGR